MILSRPLALLGLLAFLGSCSPIMAQPKVVPPDEATLDKLIAEAVSKFEVPGAAVVIVKDDKVVYVKGFGVRKLGEPALVTPDTIFAIASCSKAFTTTGIAMLVADGKMKWDDKVTQHVDWFHLSDPSADREVTLRDLVSHRTGMPRHDMLWVSSTLTAEEYIRAYGKAKKSTSFRSSFEYANIPFTTAGFASGKVAGSDWSTFTNARIFDPLGMKSTYCSAEEAMKQEDFATPHNRHLDGKVGPVYRASVDSVRAAGSINSTVRDLGQWLRFHLADGKLDGKQLIPAKHLKETRTPQMVIRQQGSWVNTFPEKFTRHISYGLGWFISEYRGHLCNSHGGTLDGFRAQTMLFPEEKLGIVVLGNLTPSYFTEAMTKAIADRYLGLPQEDWVKFYKDLEKKRADEFTKEIKDREGKKKPNTKPSLELKSYAGHYKHPAYGPAEVVVGEKGLELKWGGFGLRLDHYHFDGFTGYVITPANQTSRFERDFFPVQFKLNDAGEVTEMEFMDQGFEITKQTTSTTPTSFDLLIRDGTLYDGSGQLPRKGDIAIKGDRVVALGDLKEATAKKVIDAKGMAVAPGFINMLSWSNESLLADGKGQSEIRQGVTTQIMGEGWSMGPLSDTLKKQMQAGQADIKYPVEWNTLSEYLYFLERRGVSHNVASYVGATTIREYVLGDSNKKPTLEELERMKKLVEIEMRAGALGIGTALEYSPAYYADTNELIELCKVAAKHKGKYITHMRSEGPRLLEGIDEAIQICREAKIPTEIYHLKAAGPPNWKKMDEALAKIEKARKEGLPLTANMYPYTAGAAPLTACIPPWASAGGDAAMRRRLRDPAERPKIITDITAPKSDWPNFYLNSGGAKGIILLGFKKDALKPLQGKTLAEVARMRNKAEPAEVLIDLLLEDESSIGVAYFITAEENIRKIVPLPWVSFGSDESSQAPEGVFLKSIPHPRAYGCFARVLGKYVREENLLPLESAIHKMSHLPATNLGLEKRGLLKEGYFADVVVFDPNTIGDKATYEKPQQYSVGMKHVFVNGTQVLADGEHTGAKPGKAVWGPGKVEK
jgi:N-acyl-D-amino-acid deacylase